MSSGDAVICVKRGWKYGNGVVSGEFVDVLPEKENTYNTYVYIYIYVVNKYFEIIHIYIYVCMYVCIYIYSTVHTVTVYGQM